MGFLSSQGSLDQTSSRNSPVSVRTELTEDNLVVNNEVISQERALQDTFLPSTAVNTDVFKNELSMLAGFPDGRILEVTYFSQVNALTNIRSMNVERITSDTDWTHYSFTQIRNFELRVTSELNFDYSADTNVSSVSGEALMLAGFEPLVNDLFLYKLRNDKTGIFVINSVQRTALGNDTYHRVTFDLTQYLNGFFQEKLVNATKTIVYFDKTKFTVGNHAFLTTDGFSQKKDLISYKQEIVNDYMEKFYTNEINSFLRPDGVYDPYVVEFWNRKVGYNDCNTRPTQMLVSQHAYPRTIWAVLTGTPIRDISKLEHEYLIFSKRYATWDTNVNALVDKCVLLVGSDIEFEISSNNLRRFMSSTASDLPYFDHANKSIVHHLESLHKLAYHDNPNPPNDGQCIHDLPGRPVDPGFTWPPHHHHHHGCHHHHPHYHGKVYALSDKFYKGDATMSTLEQLVYDNVNNKDISINTVISTIEHYQEWDLNDAFYWHLLSLHLIDYCQYWLVHRS